MNTQNLRQKSPQPFYYWLSRLIEFCRAWRGSPEGRFCQVCGKLNLCFDDMGYYRLLRYDLPIVRVTEQCGNNADGTPHYPIDHSKTKTFIMCTKCHAKHIAFHQHL